MKKQGGFALLPSLDGVLKKSSYGSQTTDYTYNLANLLTELNNANGSTQISKYSYTYYVDGNQKSKTESIGRSDYTTNYTYDGLNRLISEASTGGDTYDYQYDSYGNRTKLTCRNYSIDYTYDKNNRLISEKKNELYHNKETDYWYDPNGNQISSLTIEQGIYDSDDGASIYLAGGGVGGDINSYSEYNSWNQLTKTMHGKTASYTYNGDGLRMSKTVDGVTTSHIWDGTNIAGDVTNGTVTKYIRGLQLISSKKGSNESFYTYNGHGDVVQLTDGSGSITKKYSYDAFGVEYNKDSRDTNPFRYCGEYYDTETDSVYLRARYYRPTTGRFISEDPIMDGLNWYVYCENEPVMGLDPSGLAIYVPENRGTIEEYLKVISHNKIYIDDNGYVKKVDENYIPDYNNEIGTDLIFQLIDDKVNTCTIRIGDFNGTDRSNDEYASKSGVGCNAFVTFKSDYNNQDDVPVMAENGSVIKERQPVQIALGHELVHALRTMKGNRKRGYLKGTNAMVGGDNQEYTQEEFDTVGIDHWRDDGSYANASEWHFTENSLRRELGFCTRVRYYMR